MTTDSGFAPNPFGGFMTLATCKPLIREKKNVGDYIAGFTSASLNGDAQGKERMVYLMQVTDKIDFKEYFLNPIYQKRKPDLTSKLWIEQLGDNIYMPIFNFEESGQPLF